MLKIVIPALAAAMLSACEPAPASLPSEVTMSREVLMDKIQGGWAGQIIGCTYGGPTEFKYATIIDKNVDIPWHEHMVKQWFDNQPGLYDDVYMDLTFVDVFAKEGLDAPVESFANAFANAGYPLWHANAQARYNILQGIMPPASGHWENNPHADDIDFQIEADYAGLMAPGMVNAASYYCDAIGHIMNYGDGWYGGVYMAAMYALAFVSDDVEFVVTEALKAIPEQSRFHKCMSDVIRWHRENDDWMITWLYANRDYGFDIGCPEGVYSAYDIDAVLNSAYVIIGLLYGEKNFFKTIDISCRCGCDSDCNPASAAGILGTMIGWSNIPEYWRKPVEEVADREFKYTDISFNRASELSFDQALQVIALNGGGVTDSDVTIKVQEPESVRFEQCFEGHWPTGIIYIRKNVGQFDSINFTGKGIVLRYDVLKGSGFKQKDYVAEVEVYLDGELSEVRHLPVTGNGMAPEFYYKYNLPAERHTITMKWTNKPSDLDIRISRGIVYSDKAEPTKHQ